MTNDPGPSAQKRQISIVEAVTQAIRAGDMATAKDLARRGLSAGVEHPLLLNIRALSHEDEGRLEDALADLRRAHILAPQDFSILNACGLCLARLARLDEAIQCLDRALTINPDFGPAWYNRGWTLERLGETAKASEAYLKSVEINPENALGWANLAHLAARRGDGPETRRLAEAALALQPGYPTAILALAAVELATPEVAERRLRGLLNQAALSAYDRALAHGQLGDVLDAADRPSEAFTAYSQSNVGFRSIASSRFEAPGQRTMADTLNWLIAWAESLTPESWIVDSDAPRSHSPCATHVFMIGFPRSGTTLAESVLTRHPDIISLEEKNTFDAAVLDFLRDRSTASRFATMGNQELQFYREDYWNRVRSFGADPSGKIFIDKHPFNTLKIALIYKLFPAAKIIFCVRDPRDVVLSCFRRRFDLNSSMYEFLDLPRTARLYDRTMHLATVFREIQKVDEHRLVYEKLVQDFEVEAKSMCDFIGAEWSPELIDFSSRAKGGGVASASSAQIARGLYQDGIGHWKRYRDQLAPAMQILRPWIERFGYALD